MKEFYKEFQQISVTNSCNEKWRQKRLLKFLRLLKKNTKIDFFNSIASVRDHEGCLSIGLYSKWINNSFIEDIAWAWSEQGEYEYYLYFKN